MRRTSCGTVWLGVLALLASIGIAIEAKAAQPYRSNPLDAMRAYRYLEQVCDLGPRFSGSPGMRAQQEMSAQAAGGG